MKIIFITLICAERFVAVQDSDKKGLPRVIESVVVSSKTRMNIPHLCQLIYSTAIDQRSPGTKERLLDQKIPASYIAFEEVCDNMFCAPHLQIVNLIAD